MSVCAVRFWLSWLLVGGALALPVPAPGQEALPRGVAGVWRITRILPVHAGNACWTAKQAEPLVGSMLSYTSSSLRWRGGVVPLTGVTTRIVGTADLAEEELRGDRSMTLADLGFSVQHVREVNLQHEDADITGATTEVPGDSVLIAGRGRLVLSACGVYLEARRLPVAHEAARPAIGSVPSTGERSGS